LTELKRPQLVPLEHERDEPPERAGRPAVVTPIRPVRVVSDPPTEGEAA
jgi:hypothetical protein